MSVAIIPDEFEKKVLELILQEAPNSEVRLFKNDYTPDPSTTEGDLEEADYAGYAAKTWTWTGPTTDGTGKAQTSANIFTFDGPTDSVPQDIYGFYVRTYLGAWKLAMVGRFGDAPITLSAPGDELPFSLQMKAFDVNS